MCFNFGKCFIYQNNQATYVNDGCSSETVQLPVGTKTNLRVTACDQTLSYEAGNQKLTCQLTGPLVNSQTAQRLDFSATPAAGPCNVRVDNFQLFKLVTKAPTLSPTTWNKAPGMI